MAGPFAFDHVALDHESLEDLFRLKDRFAAAEVPAPDVPDHGFLYSVYIQDTNGITVECCSPDKGTDLAPAPVAVEPTSSAVAAEGINPNPAIHAPPPGGATGRWFLEQGTGSSSGTETSAGDSGR